MPLLAISVPATAFESSMPNAFSISGHFGWRGRGVEASIAFISIGIVPELVLLGQLRIGEHRDAHRRVAARRPRS